ncbi:cation:proton antiporter domain-containing protein [Haloarcula marismortui]|uniref:Cation:proton antiporter n=1 Tax=Haloarcula marismortui ATCC 33800 TaxID=662476 RepID=M0K0L4_9EURY|nr:cation:proton antiporter [Haloarcula sinaiiensis]EMA14741.1 Na+/H+ antiporter, NhaA family protein [Haloarcula sinaiiensis ATCC 33800]QUJ71852.1 cation:proton antiporter [Haloarcula sinaiiensis ATCC 33800]
MSGAESLIGAVVLVVSLGVAAQLVADWLQIPSVAFLLVAGVLVGPQALGLVDPAIFGQAGLQAIVGLSVGIIVFEGAFHLTVERVREASREALGLVTIGAFVSLVGTAVAVKVVFGTTWPVAVLVGSLLIATGPTVITPIMQVVPVRDRVAAALETEGIINDVTAAILAVATFEFVIASQSSPVVVIEAFVARLAVGHVVGIAVGGGTALLLKRWHLSADNALQNARVVVLTAALLAYALGSMWLSEAGIAAAAIAGIVLGNAEIPHKEEVAGFKGGITLFVLSFVFIVLAAQLSLGDLRALGVGGLVVVIVVAALVRPLGVFLSTLGGRLTVRERMFVGGMGPRGIVPASVATLFAIELRPENPEAATVLVGTVFLVIFATVMFQGGLARHFAQALDILPMQTLIVGGGRVGRELAVRYESRGEEVVLIDSDEDTVERTRADGHRVVHGDATNATVLEEAGANRASVVVAATADDDVNLLVAQLATTRFDIDTVVARANQPDNVEVFEDLDVETISAGFAVADAIDDAVERPALAHWLSDSGRTGDVLEVELSNDSLVDRTIEETAEKLPNGCLVAMVSRNGTDRVPDSDFRLASGDHLTLVCETNEAMQDARRLCQGG